MNILENYLETFIQHSVIGLAEHKLTFTNEWNSGKNFYYAIASGQA